MDRNICNDFEFRGFSIYTLPEMSGDVELVISAKDIEEDQTLTIAAIDEPITVKITNASAKVGQKNQTGGKIIISENGRGKINKGFIKIRIAGEEYINFKNEPRVEVIEGDLEVKNMGWEDSDENILMIKVTSTSKEASAIEISGFKFSVDDMAPDGKFSVFLSGNAIAPETRDKEVEYKGFITTSLTGTFNNNNEVSGNNTLNNSVLNNVVNNPNVTPNTNTNLNQSTNTNANTNTNINSNTDNNNVQTSGIVTNFVVGSRIYEVAGKRFEMEAEAYKDNGRVMVPIRYAVEAAGINSKDVKYKDGIITINAGKTEIVMVMGSNIVSINNIAKMMVTAPVSRNDRTYVPISEIANILGLKVSWNGLTQTATFIR